MLNVVVIMVIMLNVAAPQLAADDKTKINKRWLGASTFPPDDVCPN
jgi:hypothetical protein